MKTSCLLLQLSDGPPAAMLNFARYWVLGSSIGSQISLARRLVPRLSVKSLAFASKKFVIFLTTGPLSNLYLTRNQDDELC